MPSAPCSIDSSIQCPLALRASVQNSRMRTVSVEVAGALDVVAVRVLDVVAELAPRSGPSTRSLRRRPGGSGRRTRRSARRSAGRGCASRGGRSRRAGAPTRLRSSGRDQPRGARRGRRCPRRSGSRLNSARGAALTASGANVGSSSAASAAASSTRRCALGDVGRRRRPALCCARPERLRSGSDPRVNSTARSDQPDQRRARRGRGRAARSGSGSGG